MKQAALIGAIVVVALTLAADKLIPQPADQGHHRDRLLQQIPSVLGAWTLEREMPVTEEETRILGTDDIFHRLYRQEAMRRSVTLSLVFSSGHRHSMHPPEICYQSGGYTLVTRGSVLLDHGTWATSLNLVQDADNQLVNYWFFSEGRETASYIIHQIHLVINQILMRSQPSVLIRIATQIKNNDTAAAQATLSDFASAAIPILRDRLTGLSSEKAGASQAP